MCGVTLEPRGLDNQTKGLIHKAARSDHSAQTAFHRSELQSEPKALASSRHAPPLKGPTTSK